MKASPVSFAGNGDLSPGPRTRAALDLPMPRVYLAAILLAYAWTWWDLLASVYRKDIESQGPAPAHVLPLAAGSALVMRAAGFLIEAGIASAAWRALGRRLPYWPLVAWLALLSGMDLMAESLRVQFEEHRWLAVLTGYLHGRRPDSEASLGFASAFGGIGLLAAGRMIASGWIQARAVGTPWIAGVGLVFGFWTATRLVIWWTIDLLQASGGMRG